MPEISVIMPVYNTEETFLRHAIESILVQSFADFELIVVNDGANAQTTLVIDKYATEDKRIKVIHNPVNKGVSFARNIGKTQAVGEFIMFVDADDLCHPELLQILYQTLVDNQADIAGCCVKNITQDHEFENQNAGHPKIKIFANPLDAFMKKRNIRTEVFARLYRKNIVENIRFPEGIRYEDVYFTTLAMFGARSFVMIENELYGYRKHARSFVREDFTQEKAKYYLDIIRQVDAFFKTKNDKIRRDVRRNILNQRVKMIFNQSVRRQRENSERKRIFSFLQGELRNLYAHGIVDYQMLKVKHKISLWLLLNLKNPKYSLLWTKIAKEF